MSSFCLSSAVILRCVPLSSLQSIVILIPTALEVVFTSSLVLMLWNSGHRRHLLLTAEGWVYFLLSVFELLTHVLDSAQRDVNVFSAFDVTVGVASFLPLFLYCFFLYIYSDSELLPNAVSLPKKLARLASLLLLLLIPAIVGVNEVASFVGIERRLDPRNVGQMVIGFSSQRNWTLNMFFSSLSLALITLFQAIIFLITGFRLVVAIINQRRFEQLGQDAAHMVKGVGWLSAGMKMGAIESVIGFAGGSFGIILTRRIFRFLGRACLCIGLVKGVDEIEDFRAVRQEMSKEKSPRHYQRNPRGIKDLISNPRLSTFQQLPNPPPEAFYTLPRDHLLTNPTFDYNRAEALTVPWGSRTPEDQLRSLPDIAGVATFESMGQHSNEPRQRVTVHYRDSDGAPTLHLRLSDTELPNAGQIQEAVASRPRSWLPFAFGSRRKSSSLNGLPPSIIPTGVVNEKEDAQSIQARYSRELLSAPGKMGDRDSKAQSFIDASVEIVTAPQRTLSQSAARGRLYRASTKSKLVDSTMPPSGNAQKSGKGGLNISSGSPSVGQDDANAESKNSSQPAGLESPISDQESQVTSRHKSRIISEQSFRSLPDTLQAVRELAHEFPGPPLTYNGRPVMGSLTPVSAWNESPHTPSLFSKSVRSSLQAVGNAIGSPKDLLKFNRFDKRGGGGRTGPKVEDEERLIGESYAPHASMLTPESMDGPSASRGSERPQIFVSTEFPEGKEQGAIQRSQQFVKPKPSFVSTHTHKSIDPFDDSQSPTPTTPVQDIMIRPTLLRPHPRLDVSATRLTRAVSAPSSPENLSGFPVGGARESQVDPFNELAVRTGGSSDIRKSGRWKGDSSTLRAPPEQAIAPGEGLPTTPVRRPAISPIDSATDSRLSFGQVMLGSTASVHKLRRPPSKIIWKTQGEVEEQSRNTERPPPQTVVPFPQRKDSTDPEEAHRRQKSIEAAAHLLSNSIPWLKNPEVEEEERKLREAMASTSLVTRTPKISRVKTVGSVDVVRTTPGHTTEPMRQSLRVDPIMIPLPPRSLTQILDVSQDEDDEGSGNPRSYS